MIATHRFAHRNGQGAGSSGPVDERPLTVLLPDEGWASAGIGELWRFRDLLYSLAWRDLKVRYKQTVLGAAWAILQPALMMVVFSVFFGRMGGVPSDGLPYPLFALAGLLPWMFFATAVTHAGNSVVGSERLITKVYFPRLTIPLAAVAAAFADFGVACGLLAAMMFYYGVAPGPIALVSPLIFGLIAIAAAGVGILLAALNVAYRDFRYVIPFLVQLWMFATPTVYMQPASAAPTASARPEVTATPKMLSERVLRAALALNPMTELVGAFRSSVLGGPLRPGPLGTASASVALAFVGGCLYFRKVEGRFADIL